jgi:hypothetical protein
MRMALGLSIFAPKSLQTFVYLLCSSAFIGLPCPKNAAGMRALATVLGKERWI